MTTDSALRDKIAKLLADRIGHGLREKTDAVAGEVLAILTAAGAPPVYYVKHDGTHGEYPQPAQAGMVMVPRETLKWWRELVDLNPADLAPRMDRYLAAAPTTPPPTLNEAFDQVGAAMLREVRGDGAHVADEETECAALQATFPDLPHATRCLVWNFAVALGSKLAEAEKKYGYSEGWRNRDWADECRTQLLEHVAKGDPRDVAAYCAFAWYHGWSTAAAPAAQVATAPKIVAWTEKDGDDWVVYDAESDTGQHVANYQKSRHFKEIFPIYDAAPAVVVDEASEGYYLASFKQPWRGGPILWWRPDDAGYTTDLQQAGIYTKLKPGYHDSGHTVPVPVSYVRRLRIRHEVDPGDSENEALWTAEKLRAALAAEGKG